MDTELSPLDRERITEVLRKESFIEAVKLYRATTRCDLATAKAAVEQNVQFTDGSTLIATGRISGVVGGVGGPSGLTVTSESPETVKALARAFAR